MSQPGFQIENQRQVYECPRFKVEEVRYSTPGGGRRTFTIRPPNDLVIIIPRLEGKLLLINKEAPPIPQKQWMFPTGFVTPGVAIADTAQTVLIENTGTVAQKYIYIGKIYPSQYLNAIAHIMIGDGLQRLKGQHKDFEDSVAMLSQKEIGSLLIDRTFNDGLALATYTYYVTSDYYWTEVQRDEQGNSR